jgi:hypothetical protein
VVWAYTVTGKRIPLDPALRDAGHGRFEIRTDFDTGRGIARSLPADDRTLGRVSHFSSCPDAKQHRSGAS